MSLRRALPDALVPLGGIIVGLGLAVGAAASANHAEGFRTASSVVAAGSLVFVVAMARPAWTISLGLALTAFNSHWQEIGLPFSVDRLVLGVGVASLLVREVRAHGVRSLRTSPTHWLIAGVAIYAVTSAALAGTLDESAARSELIDRLGLFPFLMFFIAPLAFREPRDRQVFIGVFVALGAYLGVTALLETIGPKALIFPGYITDPSIGIHADRARGPFVEAAANGMGMFVCGVAAAIALATWQSRRWRYVAGAVLVLCMLGELFTLTRAVWLSAGIATVVALLSAARTRRLIVPVGIVGLVLVVGIFAAVPGLRGRADARSNDQAPVWDRKNSDIAALKMIDAKPLLGFGWGRFAFDSGDYYQLSPDYPLSSVPEVHNVFLSNAVELGLIGGLLWLAALVAGVGGALFKRGPPDIELWKVGLIALLVEWLVVANTTPLSFTLPTVLLWTWAGIVRGAPDVEPRAVATPAARSGDPSPAPA
jgi:putative inorganic carbon (HCO3(-)) transporter